MPNNNRIFWAIQAVGIAPYGSSAFTTVHGLQSVGITTSFNLEQIFEVGQLEIYENIEDIPDVEVTLEKVIDGYPLIYHLATRGYAANTLSGRQNQRAQVALAIYGDTQNSASGVQITEVECSGMYVSNLTYTFPTEGSCTEAVTLVGNNKQWHSSGFVLSGTLFDNTDSPLSLTSGTGGVQRRENVVFGAVTGARDSNGMVDGAVTILPPDIPGISSTGTNFADANGFHVAHVSQITVSTDLGRDELRELGLRGPYHRFITFPTEVTCEIEILTHKGDQIDALEESISNLTERSIRVQLEEGLLLNLGLKNKLANVTYGGADAGGGNASVTYSYSSFNILEITHPQDPVVA